MGALAFAKMPAIQKLDFFFAAHLGIVSERKLVCGTAFLCEKTYKVDFAGRSAHSAGAPERGKNALLAASTAANNLYSIPRHKEGITRVNVGNFHACNAPNVICDHASFEMEVRGENLNILDFMETSAKRIVFAAATMHDVDIRVEEESFHVDAPNDPELKAVILRAAKKAGIPESAILDEYQASGCEDATNIMREVQAHGGKATYICLGSDTKGGHHNPCFDFDEDLLGWGVEIFWNAALSINPKRPARKTSTEKCSK